MRTEIDNALEVLRKGGTILYPTDTVWGIGCDATNPKAADKIYKLKKREEHKTMIILLDKKEKLKHYVDHLPDITFDLINSIEAPTTIIYANARNLAKNVIAKDGTVAIRIVQDEFCQSLIKDFEKPIVSTSANLSGEPTPLMLSNINPEIYDYVDYVVKLRTKSINKIKPSTIIRLHDDGEYQIIRS